MNEPFSWRSEDEGAAQLRLIAEEDQWKAQWDPAAPPPKNVPDLRPVVQQMDETLRAAARCLELGLVLSPATVQLLKNALYMYEAGQAFLAGDLSGKDFNAFAAWIEGNDENGG
jgi:hypothetical protein